MSGQEQPIYAVSADPAGSDDGHIDTFVSGMRLPDGRTIMMRTRTDTPGPLEEQSGGQMLIRAMMNAMPHPAAAPSPADTQQEALNNVRDPRAHTHDSDS